jgi:ABC-type multidrug transport system ATPase subunit
VSTGVVVGCGSEVELIVVDGLVKRFKTASRGEFLAVNNLCFQVEAGEVYGLLGPNGAGKTTTLRMLATLVSPDSGRITVDGINGATHPLKVRETLAYVPAEAGLPDRLTPLEVVSLYAAIQGVRQPKQRALELLEQLGCASYLHSPSGDLSTGMKRRVVLARALAHRPRVLLLDEPTDGLDVPGRREVLAIINELAADGRTVIVSSHIMAEVERVANRIGIMNHGAMVAEGSLEELFALTQTTQLDDALVSLISDDDKDAP